ncbi:hypothetical protein GYA49_02375 [Candidatus Beckwithbacteria bacterium]|nr:hypothetical protein [Candidatus Beckwithbacteria bacterium]
MKYLKQISIFFVLPILLFLLSTTALAQYATPLNPGKGLDGGIGPYNVPIGSGDIAYLSKLESIFSIVVSFMTILTGLFFIIHFVIGGFTWSTAGGDSQKVETAKTKMTNAAIGLIIVIASYSIIYIIGKVLGLDILNVGSLIYTYLRPS